MTMASKEVIRLPVDNDPDIRATVIPAIQQRILRLTKRDETSQAEIIRWGLRVAASQADAPDALAERDDSFHKELSAARERMAQLEAQLDDASIEIAALRARASVAAAPTVSDAARLKSAREAAGLSSGALGRMLGYTDHSAVSQQERGRAPLSDCVRAWLEGQGR
jgi:DNA-binding transcriptional regulator YiaG